MHTCSCMVLLQKQLDTPMLAALYVMQPTPRCPVMTILAGHECRMGHFTILSSIVMLGLHEQYGKQPQDLLDHQCLANCAVML